MWQALEMSQEQTITDLQEIPLCLFGRCRSSQRDKGCDFHMYKVRTQCKTHKHTHTHLFPAELMVYHRGRLRLCLGEALNQGLEEKLEVAGRKGEGEDNGILNRMCA